MIKWDTNKEPELGHWFVSLNTDGKYYPWWAIISGDTHVRTMYMSGFWFSNPDVAADFAKQMAEAEAKATLDHPTVSIIKIVKSNGA